VSCRAAAWFAWSLAGLSLALFAGGVALHFATLPVQPPSSWGPGGASAVLYVYLPFLAFPLVGALIASRRAENPVGWLCLAVGLLWILSMVGGSYAIYGIRVAGPTSVPYPAAVGSLSEWLGPTAVMLLGTYMILLFPDGMLPSRRWRPVAWLSGIAIASNIVVTTLAPFPLSDLRDVRNPFGLEGQPWVAHAFDAVNLLLPLCLLLSASSLVLRYRSSTGEVREQIKWIAFAASLVALGVSAAMVGGVFSAPDATADAGLSWGSLLEAAITLSFAGIPSAIGFAVLKYRLYDIDVLINRALVYGVLTVLLAAVYFGGVAATQTALRVLTGQEFQLAIVASTLAIAALFNPLRRRIQGSVDRRFYRRKYDARKILDVFSARLRNETDLEVLSGDLVSVTRETLQSEHASLWLQDGVENFGQRPPERLA
jgi:hypothetical protein